ncbi:MAG: glycosyl hydrolase family 18 protein [Lachnospiraceae bacterium]|nr:glycosyl hydrolase family 18 protein [Lachnospiraceae bacterium]MDD7667904.1 glycosyl hydrolase family 18 protein [Lachnospiraceae bacterium]MDY2620716.1 glycosyl hydrolase family 18 protein [Agathobacter sp.]
MKKKTIPILTVCALIVIIVAIIGGSVLLRKYTPSKEHKGLTSYYNITADNQVAIVLNNELTSSYATLIDGHIYVDYNFVHDTLNSRFYWDHNENILLYATSRDLISAEADSNKYLITKSSVDYGRPVVKANSDSAYIDLDFVKEYTDLTYKYIKDPNRIIITNQWGDYETASVKKNSTVRVKGGIKSPILKDITETTDVTVIEQGDKWSKILTADGIIGYVQNKRMSDISTKTRTSDFTPDTFAHITKDFNICMAWHQVTNSSANANIASVLSSTKGVNVISPTWFYLNDNNGNLANLASLDYVNYCHSQGVEVWALVSNLENKDADSAEVLTHTSKRQNLVNQIVSMAIQYNLDGINLDFESLNQSKVGDAYIEFVRELSIKCANNGIVLSIDNYVPTSYTAFYNRAEQANFADYIVIMGYDEHYAGGDAGSVSSIGWVKQGVADTLTEVPADQIILGMPFYTRVWQLTPKDTSSKDSSDSNDSSYDVSSKIYGMRAADALLTDNDVTKTWDQESGQNYAEFTSGDSTFKVWLEDANSAEERLKIVKDNKLAGASFWKLGFETSDIWNTIIKYTN